MKEDWDKKKENVKVNVKLEEGKREWLCSNLLAIFFTFLIILRSSDQYFFKQNIAFLSLLRLGLQWGNFPAIVDS